MTALLSAIASSPAAPWMALAMGAIIAGVVTVLNWPIVDHRKVIRIVREP